MGQPQSDPTKTAFDQPDGLLIELESLVEPLRLEALFPNLQPLEVELGSGDGSFLVDYARRHPERNFLGIERLLGRLRKLDRKGRRLGLSNVRGLQIESSYFLKHLLVAGSVAALHVYFPDPWPKRKQRKNRLVNLGFPALAGRVLKPGGVVYFRTDNLEYLAQIVEAFRAAPNFGEVQTPPELLQLVTDFEREFLARGVATSRVAYQRIR